MPWLGLASSGKRPTVPSTPPIAINLLIVHGIVHQQIPHISHFWMMLIQWVSVWTTSCLSFKSTIVYPPMNLLSRGRMRWDVVMTCMASLGYCRQAPFCYLVVHIIYLYYSFCQDAVETQHPTTGHYLRAACENCRHHGYLGTLQDISCCELAKHAISEGTKLVTKFSSV